MQRLRISVCTIEMGFILTDVVTDLRARWRIIAPNIAMTLLQMRQDENSAPHAYAKTLEAQAPEFFHSKAAALPKNTLPPQVTSAHRRTITMPLILYRGRRCQYP